MPIWMPVVLAALSAVVATILVIATTAGDDEPPPAAGTEQTAAGAEGGQGGFQITGTFEPARAEPAPEGLVERPRAMMPRGDGIGQRMFDVLGTVRAVWQRDADRRAIGAAEGVRGGARHVADDVAPAPGPRRDQGSELRDERRREERAGRREDREARGEEPEVRPEPLTERAEPRATVAPRIEVPAVAPEVAAPAVNEPAVVVPPRREPEAGAAEGTEPSRPNRPASPVEEESEEEEVRPPVSF